MIDLSTVKYRVVIVDDKTKYNITDYVESLCWEENDGEIAMRLSLTLRNEKIADGFFMSLIKQGGLILVSAKHGNQTYKQVARGIVVTRNPANQNSSHDFKCVCYDELYNLQKSQDNFFFRSGTCTKNRIKKILKKWKISLGSYDGPNKKHGKKKYQNQYLSDILLSILDDAIKKDGRKYILRLNNKGKVTISPLGSNDDIYVFKPNNTKVAERSNSTADLVTRVKVVGTSKDSSKSKVVATVNGLTKYGIRQRIYTRGSDETTKQAKKAAQEILNESGNIKKEVTIQSPDIPYIRKGDMVYMDVGAVQGYYYVLSIAHNAESFSMTMKIEPAEKSNVSKNNVSQSKSYQVGDVVTFNGGKHYVSSTGSKSYTATPGKAKITKKNISGKHPYHLIHTNSKSNVYGWVDESTFS